MCASQQVWIRQTYLLHPTWWWVWPHDIPSRHPRQAPHLGWLRRWELHKIKDWIPGKGEDIVQSQIDCEQRWDHCASASRCWLSSLQVKRWYCEIRAWLQLNGVVHQAVRWPQRVPHESSVRFPNHRSWGEIEVQSRSHPDQVRDPILHCLWSASPLPQDRREEWLPGTSLGEIYHSKWWIPDQDAVSKSQPEKTIIKLTVTIKLVVINEKTIMNINL